jgi:hypothetical protein
MRIFLRGGLVVAAGTLMLGACGTAAPTAVPLRTFAVDTSFGTLRFLGQVVQFELGDRYQYKAQLRLTFDRFARTNSTSSIHLTTARFVATIAGDPREQARLVYEQSQPISADFTADGDTRQLPELTFSIEKSVAALATSIALGVSDDRLLWPVPGNLK